MATYEEKKNEIQRARDQREAERAAAHAKEFEDHVYAVLVAETDVVHLELKDVPADLPGHFVARLPVPAEWSRFRTLMWKDAKERGVLEAKSKAGLDLAHQCRLYPSADRFAELLTRRPGIGDIIGGAMAKAAMCQVDEAGKG